MNQNAYQSLIKKVKEFKKDEPFLATITVFNKERIGGQELETFLFINNFPYEEFEGTKLEIVKLIDQAE